MGKSDRATVVQRVAVVQEMIIKGFRTTEIVQYGTQTWGLKDRQIRKYISHANKKISSSYDKKIELTFVKNEARLTELYRLAVKKSQYSTAKDIVRELNSMYGINLLRADITTKGKEIEPKRYDLSNFTDSQLVELISKLEN